MKIKHFQSQTSSYGQYGQSELKNSAPNVNPGLASGQRYAPHISRHHLVFPMLLKDRGFLVALTLPLSCYKTLQIMVKEVKINGLVHPFTVPLTLLRYLPFRIVTVHTVLKTH